MIGGKRRMFFSLDTDIRHGQGTRELLPQHKCFYENIDIYFEF